MACAPKIRIASPEKICYHELQMKIDYTTLNFRCPEEDFDTMIELCEQNDMSTSDFITQAILMYTDFAEKEGDSTPAAKTKNANTTHG